VDFARIFFTSALSRVGSSLPPLTVPRIALDVPWKESLTKALALEDDADRALALCDLAAATHPASARGASALAERTRTLKRQIAAVEALNHAAQLVRERRFDEVLAYLDKLDLAIASEPRLLRLRVLALLALRRFDDADAVIEQIGEGGSVEVREFVEQYPALSFRQRIAAAQQFLRDLKPQEAESVLRSATAANPKDQADLAYCKAFASALDGYDLRRKGRDTEARPRFLAALGFIEPHVDGRNGDAGRHIVELYDRLEKEIESHAGR
jgi:tetratricopeptide (TPR) repeat protein